MFLEALVGAPALLLHLAGLDVELFEVLGERGEQGFDGLFALLEVGTGLFTGGFPTLLGQLEELFGAALEGGSDRALKESSSSFFESATKRFCSSICSWAVSSSTSAADTLRSSSLRASVTASRSDLPRPPLGLGLGAGIRAVAFCPSSASIRAVSTRPRETAMIHAIAAPTTSATTARRATMIGVMIIDRS